MPEEAARKREEVLKDSLSFFRESAADALRRKRLDLCAWQHY